MYHLRSEAIFDFSTPYSSNGWTFTRVHIALDFLEDLLVRIMVSEKDLRYLPVKVCLRFTTTFRARCVTARGRVQGLLDLLVVCDSRYEPLAEIDIFVPSIGIW